MSSLYLLLALLATFGTVALAGYALGSPIADRRRAVRMLEAQVGVAQPPANLREQALSQSFLNRAILPGLARLDSIARKVTPLDMRKKLAHKLVLAGSPANWDAEKVIAVKLLLGVGLPLSLLLLAGLGDASGRMVFLLVGLTAYVGYLGPDIVISGRGKRRQNKIRKALSDTMDLLSISVEAGLGFDAALSQVVQKVPGELSTEIGRTLQEMQLGVSRSDAFRNLGARTDVEELKSFVLAMIQADTFGISVAQVLRTQSQDLRVKRRQTAEEKAMKLPVKILFPLIFCVLPSLFVVILGPGIIRIVQGFLGAIG